jgi:filamentous hemagglutinin family protein
MTHSPANPQGGQVASGSASINTVPGTVTINQTSDKAIINWQTFSVNSGELTKFIQPSSTSAALNRVLGGQTFINGMLSANGQIYLINGNGILIGPGGVVNAHSFIGSTRDINDNDFLSGNLHFSGSNTSGVQNLGTINALGGDVYLIGKTVDNQGSINASKGTVGLASADDVLLNLGGQDHVFVNPSASASPATTQTAIHNSGSITAARAELKAANGNLFALAINNEGTIRATVVEHRGGRVFLTTDAGTIQNSGVISAKKGANGGQVKIAGGSVWNTSTVDVSGAQGGSVAVNSQNFENDGNISAKGTSGAGGSVAVTFSGNALGSSSGLIDASGSTSGGSIQFEGTGATSMAYLSLKLDVSGLTGVGGEVQLNSPTLYLTGASVKANGATQGGRIFLGEDDPTSASPSTNKAQTVYISTGTSLLASATSSGNGGQVSTCSTGSTQFLGSAEAKGGPNGGNGGLIEVSGLTATYFGGQANASAPGGGSAGTFLLDPKYITVAATGSAGSGFEFVDPDPGASNLFGNDILSFSSNTTLITSPGDSFGGSGAGAVYLFSDVNGALISSLRGSHPSDGVGTTVDSLNNGNALVVTSAWNSSTGAITYFNGTTGVNGVVSATNSLVGATSGDQIGSGGLTSLSEDGDYSYLIYSPSYQGASGTATNAGAVTFFSVASDLLGVVGTSNSLVGSATNDRVGIGGITQLYEDGSYNYVVSSPDWSGNLGAVTFGSGTGGVSGPITMTNSLIGRTAGDKIGSGGIVTLDEDNNYAYLVYSPLYQGSSGTATNAGAVSWGSGSSGVVGLIGVGNSLVGSATNDYVGLDGYTYLYDYTTSGYNYLVRSSSWSGGLGAVTFGNGTTGVSGLISQTNSLIGVTAGDDVGSGGITTFYNSSVSAYNYIVYSPSYSSGAGAVTWGSGTSGVTGLVNSTSLVGSTGSDNIGSGGITTLNNGNYVVISPKWSGYEGAVTLVDGSNGFIIGSGAPSAPVSSGNSVIGSTGGGSTTGDQVGSGGVTDLENGVYAVLSPLWNGKEGAVTWVDAYAGVAQGGGATVGGAVTASNSLTGSAAGDQVGSNGIWNLNDGLYLVASPNWINGSTSTAGAITFVNFSGSTANFAYSPGFAIPAIGTVSSSNSLVGSATGDQVGSGTFSFGGDQILSTSNDNLIVGAPGWGGGVGAITYVNPTTGTNEAGTVGPSISLVGSSGATFNNVGRLTDLGNGNYVIDSYQWNSNVGAVTWYDGVNGTTKGTIGNSNSLTGSASGDKVGIGSGGTGAVTVLNNGNYLVDSYNWNNSTGAITLVDGSNGIPYGDGSAGTVVSTANSLTGAVSGDSIGSGGTSSPGITVLSNGNYIIESQFFGSDKGATTWGNGAATTLGASLNGQVVSSGNSLVGSTGGDEVGGGGIYTLSNNNYLVLSGLWNGSEGAVTWGSGTSGVAGVVSASNSLVGSSANDDVGGGGITELDESGNYNYVVVSPYWSSNKGAVTFGNGATGVSGAVSSANSLVGSVGGDEIGYGGITQLYGNGSSYNYLVNSPLWNSYAGAVTFGSGLTGISGVVSSANSLVGAASGDQVGNGYIEQLYDSSSGVYNYLVLSQTWNSSAGAATWGNGATGISGVVGTANSLTGGVANAGLTFSGYTSNDSLFIVRFATDTSAGGDGRVYASSVSSPTSSSPSIDPNTLTYADSPGSSVTISASSITAITNAGTDVVLQANSDIVVNQAILTVNGSNLGGNLTFDAGRSIVINADITTDNGNLTLLANDPNALAAYRDPGLGNILVSNSTLNVGTGAFQATIAGSANAGDIALDTIDAATVDVSALDPGNITLGGAIHATTTTIDAGNMFINLAGPNAITGQWNIYSASPYSDLFGGLASNNFAVFDATPTTSVGTGNYYLFGYSPTLDVVALSRDKMTGATIDYSEPQIGVDYTVLGFVPAAALGNPFLQDTAANTLSGVPEISSLGAPASAAPGVYPIDLTPNGVALTRSGFSLAFPDSVGGVSPVIRVGNSFDDNSGDPVSQQVAAFAVTGLNNLPVVTQFYVYDPSVETFVPVTVGATSGGAINDGNGHNLTVASSTADAPGPNRLVVPGNGIWNIFGGLVHSVPPPPFVMQQFQLNLNPTVYANMHHYVFGN